MAPSLSTVIQYLLLSVPLYLFVGAPLWTTLFGSSLESTASHISYTKSDALVYPDENLTCPPHHYETHILSFDPLVIYISNFLSNEEADHLVKISEPHFQPSTVWSGGSESFDPTIRNSQKALLDRDVMVQCIEARARSFQGWRPSVFIEKLWAQRYGPGGHYVHHYDWSSLHPVTKAGRVSTFMVYLEANCTGGGTNFPRLEMPAEKRWCEFLECGSSAGEGEERLHGITFRPIKGNAVFWENFRTDGRGYEETWHAGLPVKTGTKVGLNIWSWYQPGHQPAAAEDRQEVRASDV